MKNVFAAFAQFLLFLIVLASFSFFPPFHLQRVLRTDAEGTHVFIWDGLVISALLYVLILAVEAVRKHLGRAAAWTTGAFAVAVLLGFRMGFKTIVGF